MRIAGPLLGAACAVIAWLVGLAYCLMLVVAPRVECARGDSDPFLAALALAVPLVVLLALAPGGLPHRDVLRWPTLPFAVLIPAAVRALWPYLSGADSLEHAYACDPARELPIWTSAWAPAQIGVLVWLAFTAARFWRRPAG